jgi:hypothetical protein
MKTCFSRFALIVLLTPFQSRAGDGRLHCDIWERANGVKKKYSIETESKSNHTVYYYSNAQLVPNHYIRASGMVGGGAVFLHLNLENLSTKVGALTKGEQNGVLWLGNNETSIELQCSTTLDRR